jgi:3-keto-5-aminohexanoate cleavage enzyme
VSSGSLPPLVITATPNTCWLHPEIAYPQTPAEIAAEATRCEEAGAAILHMHADDWGEAIAAVRRETGMIVQCGMSSLPVPERMAVFEQHADMISIITSHHDEAFAEVDTHALHPREELLEYAALSAEHGVKLEYEIWHPGSIWNLRWLIEHGGVRAPHFTSLFFGWPGGSWSPPTIDEYLRRRAQLPDESVATVSIMAAEQVRLLAAAIVEGDHIRVGTEDYPFNHAGEVVPTHELVAEAAQMAEALGRALATPEQAREIVGLAAPQRAPVG